MILWILIAEPKIEAIDRKAGEAIKDFKEVVFPDDYNPAGKPAAKRKVQKNIEGVLFVVVVALG